MTDVTMQLRNAAKKFFDDIEQTASGPQPAYVQSKVLGWDSLQNLRTAINQFDAAALGVECIKARR